MECRVVVGYLMSSDVVGVVNFARKWLKLYLIRLEICKNYGMVRYLYMRSYRIIHHESDAIKTEKLCLVLRSAFCKAAGTPEKLSH